MQSREKFFSRVGAVKQVASHSLAIDTLPVTASQNVVSRMLRASLTVSLFSFLESYLEDRVVEVMPVISKTGIQYSSLPERFRKLVTVKAVQGISTRLNFEKIDPLGLAERHLKAVGHFARRRPIYSPMGFSSTGSNVSEGHIVNFLKDLGVEDVWKSLAIILAQISYTPLNLQDDFTTLSRARNSCAHNPEFPIPSGDLENFYKSSIRIGVAFDIMLTYIGTAYRRATNSTNLLTLIRTVPPVVAISELTGPGAWALQLNTTNHGVFGSEAKVWSKAKSLSSVLIFRDSGLIPIKVIST